MPNQTPQRFSGVSAAVEVADDRIVIGDYREKRAVIEDGSVDLIFTDPPYDKKTLPQYKDLGQFAGRVLKPGGSLICYAGDYALDKILDLVRQTDSLKFWWPLVCLHSGAATANMRQWGVIVKHKTMPWFVKGKTRASKGFVNSLVVSEPDKEHHDWGQGLPEARYYIEHLTPPGGFVVDPYCGGGTTAVAAKILGREFMAFEIDKTTARIARTRVTECEPNEQST